MVTLFPGFSPGCPPVRRGEVGLTLLELMIAMVLLAIVSLGAMSLTVSNARLEQVAREEAAAIATARGVLEEIQGLPLADIFLRYNANPDDDPEGPGSAPGNSFVILPDQAALATGGVSVVEVSQTLPVAAASQGIERSRIEVEIFMPVNGSGELDETVTRAEWGGATWDLNADGTIEAGDRGEDFRMLPVTIEVRWQGASGARRIRISHLLTGV